MRSLKHTIITPNLFPPKMGLKPVYILKAPTIWRKGILPSLQSSVCTLIHSVLSTFMVAHGTLCGPVLGDHRGNQLSKLCQRAAGGAARQREGMWFMLRLIPIVHLYEVLPGEGR